MILIIHTYNNDNIVKLIFFSLYFCVNFVLYVFLIYAKSVNYNAECPF